MLFESLFQALPDCAFVETTFHADAVTLEHFARLYPLPATLHSAVLKRQVEFLAGRVCAQQAIARLTGQQRTEIPSHEDRSPVWPATVVGAITHTTGYAAALVAPRAVYAGLGIDCERVMAPAQLPLQRHICVPHELDGLTALPGAWPPEELLSVIFSAKESLYKCLYPQVQSYFGLHAARVLSVDVTQGTFVIQLVKTIHPAWRVGACWAGFLARQEHMLMTALVSPQESQGTLRGAGLGTETRQ